LVTHSVNELQCIVHRKTEVMQAEFALPLLPAFRNELSNHQVRAFTSWVPA